MKAVTFTLLLFVGVALSSCTIYCEDDYDCPEDCYCVEGICDPDPPVETEEVDIQVPRLPQDDGSK